MSVANEPHSSNVPGTSLPPYPRSVVVCERGGLQANDRARREAGITEPPPGWIPYPRWVMVSERGGLRENDRLRREAGITEPPPNWVPYPVTTPPARRRFRDVMRDSGGIVAFLRTRRRKAG